MADISDLKKILEKWAKPHDTRKEATDATEKKNDAPIEGVTRYGSYTSKSEEAAGIK